MNDPFFEIKEIEKEKDFAKLTVSPLANGYGHTLGNALRRVLLTSLPGAAVTSVKIAGVKHQFSSLKDVKEDVVEFCLNLKKVRFIYDGKVKAKAKLDASGAGEVRAKDIEVPANVKIANPELVLASLSRNGKLSATLEIEEGVGYLPSEDREEKEIGLIPLDAFFSPIRRVNFKVEETRVGRVTNYDKLILEIWTDGTIAPKEALVKAAEILGTYFKQVVTPKRIEKDEEPKEDILGPVGILSVEELGLPTRVANALVKAGYETVKDLVKAKRDDLVKVRNLGEKSVKIVEVALAEKGVNFKSGK